MTVEYPQALKIIAGGPWSLPQPHGHFEHPLDSRYTELRRKYALAEAVERGSNELEKLLLLKEWVAQKLQKHGWSFLGLKPLPDRAELVLLMAEQGVRFNCSFYAKVYAECCTALGYPSRVINVSMKEAEFRADRKDNIGHTVAEVWCNDWNKWVVMDCDSNLHYEKNGLPLSAAEVSMAYNENQGREVRPVYGAYKAEWDYDTLNFLDGWTEEVAAKQLEMFLAYDAIDYYGMASTAVQSAYGSELYYAPKGIHPPLVRHFKPTSPFSEWTDDIVRFNWSMNQTVIRLSCSDQDKPFPPLRAQFMTNMHDFDHYSCTLDGGANWERVDDSLTWELKQGRNELIVKAVNAMKIAGPPASAVVEYAE